MSLIDAHMAGESLADVLLPPGRDVTPRLVTTVTSLIDSRAVPATRYELAPNERLRPRDDHDTGRVYLVDSGVVSLEHFSPRGRRTILDLLPPHDFFGEDSMPGLPEQYSATAVSPATLICIKHDAFQKLVSEANLGLLWRQSLNVKARRHRSFLLRFATSDCETRLALSLFDMAYTFGTAAGPEVRIELRLRHEDYAAMVATTRSRIGIFLQRFADRGMLRRTGSGHLMVRLPVLVGYIMERMGLTPTPMAS